MKVLELLAAERSQDCEEVDGFEEVRFSLAIITDEYGDSRVEIEVEAFVVAEVLQRQSSQDTHCGGGSVTHRHDDVKEAFIAEDGHWLELVIETDRHVIGIKRSQRITQEPGIEGDRDRFTVISNVHRFGSIAQVTGVGAQLQRIFRQLKTY